MSKIKMEIPRDLAVRIAEQVFRNLDRWDLILATRNIIKETCQAIESGELRLPSEVGRGWVDEWCMGAEVTIYADYGKYDIIALRPQKERQDAKG